MIFYMYLFFLLLSAVNAAKPFGASDFDKAKMEDYYLCLETLFCDEKVFDEFVKIGKAVIGKECEGHYKDALLKGCDIYPDLTFEYWADAGKKVCVDNFGKRIDRFKDFGQSFGRSFQEHNCEFEKDKLVCQCFYDAFEETQAVVEKYTDIGICGNPEKGVKKFG